MKKLGKRNTLMMGLIIITAGMVLQCVAGDHLPVIIICSIFKGLGGGFAAGVAYGLVADTIDYGEWKTGTKAEGVGMAALTFVTKVSAGFAGAIIGWINKAGGYDPLARVQTAEAVFGLKMCFSYIPLLCCVIAIILMSRYDLDRIFPKIQEELAARRAKE